MANKSTGVCFLTIRNISHISNLQKYEKILNCHFDIIYWNRLGINETCNAEHTYCYDKPLKDNASRIQKLQAYVAFRKYATKIIKANNYDKIIVLPTQTAFAFYDILMIKFSQKYILDIRDYTAENNKIFYWLMSKLVTNAGVVALTSPAYKRFLPKHDYIITHNWAPIPSEQIEAYRHRNRVQDGPVKIYCVGGIRFFDYFKRVINAFANDNRFVLGFIGEGAEKLRPYIESANINNIIIEGRFPYKETAVQHSRADIANNLFGNHTPLLDYALSNRLYYALQFGMPVLACPDTYTAEVLSTHNIGFVFNIDDPKMCDKLWEYYESIEYERLYENCDSFMCEVWEEEDVFRKRVTHFFYGDL